MVAIYIGRMVHILLCAKRPMQHLATLTSSHPKILFAKTQLQIFVTMMKLAVVLMMLTQAVVIQTGHGQQPIKTRNKIARPLAYLSHSHRGGSYL